jgi:hypothetical protein
MHSIESLLLRRHSLGSESEANATFSEATDETDEVKEKEREKRSIMASVESLLQSRHSAGSES